MPERSKLVKMRIVNLGPIGPEGLTVALDNIVCLVGPNNAGKSTVLRAYELAATSSKFIPDEDLCRWASEKKASVELWVHIPAGTPNISEKWKEESDGLLLIRSRWEWSEANDWKAIRRTWDPEVGDYAESEKAGGLDAVFNSRLPKPLRVGALDGPASQHEGLLKLILEPVANKIKIAMADTEDPLGKALVDFRAGVREHVSEIEGRLVQIRDGLNRSHNQIFPDLRFGFNIGMDDLKVDPSKILLANSHVTVLEREQEIDWTRQGTGSQRALFWALLQVRSHLSNLESVDARTKKEAAERRKQAAKARDEAQKAKTADKRTQKLQEADKFEQESTELEARTPEEVLASEGDELSLPGYMLLMDEPEVALHPNAVRAACDYLYSLAEHSSWQVMLTTHSPQFIDPTRDHTTIVRLDRPETHPSPRTFQANSVNFSDSEKENLKALNRFDSGLAEMFFGALPVLIEGDTEFAAFDYLMRQDSRSWPIHERPTLVRVRGKETMVLVIRMLTHFKVPFAVLHDCDPPRTTQGKKCSAWSANLRIHKAIQSARNEGLRVVHRVSIPHFEGMHQSPRVGPDGALRDVSSRDKPWSILEALQAEHNHRLRDTVRAVMLDLVSPTSIPEPFEGDFEAGLRQRLEEWVQAHKIQDERYVFDV